MSGNIFLGSINVWYRKNSGNDQFGTLMNVTDRSMVMLIWEALMCYQQTSDVCYQNTSSMELFYRQFSDNFHWGSTNVCYQQTSGNERIGSSDMGHQQTSHNSQLGHIDVCYSIFVGHRQIW